MGMPSVALMGKAGSGKSSVADYLVRRQAYTKASFCAPIKSITQGLWGPEAAIGRPAINRLGDTIRSIDPNTTANLLRPQLVDKTLMVVDDVRYPEEYWLMREFGFVMIRMWAPIQYRVDRLKANGRWFADEQLEYPSETALDDLEKYKPDYAIQNWEGPHELEKEVLRVLQKECK